MSTYVSNNKKAHNEQSKTDYNYRLYKRLASQPSKVTDNYTGINRVPSSK